jgi:DNA-directed RNA polymerase specialized sigma24 family protein
MSTDDSLTQWLARLKSGDGEAARHIWQTFFARLAGLARDRLRHARRRAADEEDVALSALNSFCRGAAEGRFPDLLDGRGLWPLLAKITLRKANKLERDERRLKRGGGAVRGESALAPVDGSAAAWEDFLGREPSPALACQMADECARLLGRLGDPQLCQVALWKMDGCTNAEIAARLGCVETTVERKLRVIRSVWAVEDHA